MCVCESEGVCVQFIFPTGSRPPPYHNPESGETEVGWDVGEGGGRETANT